MFIGKNSTNCQIWYFRTKDYNYSHPAKEATDDKEKLQPIVGHVSMVTDMVNKKKRYLWFLHEITNAFVFF